MYRPDKHGRRRVVRMVYEVATFQALRDQLRCKEIWVAGARRWRDPDEDLPKDFESRRAEHYASLRKPLDPAEFFGALRQEMTAALGELDDALPGLDWVDITERPAGAIKLTPLEAAPEPRNLRRIKNEVARRWAAVPLIDVLKETVLRTGCLQAVTSVAGTGTLPPHILAERLMLAIYAYGTNTGIRSVISAAHGHSEEDIRYARRRYLTPDAARTVAIAIADATLAAATETARLNVGGRRFLLLLTSASLAESRPTPGDICRRLIGPRELRCRRARCSPRPAAGPRRTGSA